MADEEFKDLPIKTASDKVLHAKAFNIVKIPKYDGYQRRLTSMVDKVFDKKVFSANTLWGVVMRARSKTFLSKALATCAMRDTQDKIMSDQKLAEELHKPIIKKFKKRKVH